MPEFDAIVVGAGPAGCACAHTLAKSGAGVLLIERGKYPGAKNVWGGALYSPALGQITLPFPPDMPLERYVARHAFSFVSAGSSVNFEFRPGSGPSSERGFIVIRARFDRWLAQKAVQAGAVLAAGVDVEDLLRENGRVIGVKAGGDKITSSVVVACDGVNSRLAQKAGLREDLRPDEVKQGVKEVIGLPRQVIEQRFGLRDDEGVAWQFVGCTRGLPGGGFIYTNRESVSLGIVSPLNALLQSKTAANDLLEDFKKHPTVAGLIEGGKLLEYSAHLIPHLQGRLPRLYGDGVLVAGDAAGLVLGTGLVLEGANFALASGVAAGLAVLKARENGDFSARSLSRYQSLLEKGFVLRDLKTFRHADRFMENPRLFSAYPQLACALAERVFSNSGQPRKMLWQIFKEEMRGKVSLWQMARDLIQARRAL